MDNKDIRISKDLHKELQKIKLEHGFKSMDELIKGMLVVYSTNLEGLKGGIK